MFRYDSSGSNYEKIIFRLADLEIMAVEFALQTRQVLQSYVP